MLTAFYSFKIISILKIYHTYTITLEETKEIRYTYTYIIYKTSIEYTLYNELIYIEKRELPVADKDAEV